MSLAQVSKKAGLTKPALNQMELGHTGRSLDRVESYVKACGGSAVVVIAGRDEPEKTRLAEALQDMDVADVRVLLRLVKAREVLPPMELELLAAGAELRARALSGADERGLVVPLRRQS